MQEKHSGADVTPYSPQEFKAMMEQPEAEREWDALRLVQTVHVLGVVSGQLGVQAETMSGLLTVMAATGPLHIPVSDIEAMARRRVGLEIREVQRPQGPHILIRVRYSKPRIIPANDFRPRANGGAKRPSGSSRFPRGG